MCVEISAFNAGHCVLTIERLTSCATAHYVNGTVETDTRESCHLGPFVAVRQNSVIKDFCINITHTQSITIKIKVYHKRLVLAQQSMSTTFIWATCHGVNHFFHLHNMIILNKLLYIKTDEFTHVLRF